MSRSLNFSGAPIDRAGATALIVASISWSLASALARKLPLPPSTVMSSGAQMLAGGTFSGPHGGRARRASHFSSLGYLARSVARVALPDCCGLYHRLYRVRLADSS